jgi:hypothetical protein
MAYQEDAYARVTPRDEQDVSGWSIGFTVFAATMMIVVGFFQFFEGLAAVIQDDFFVLGRKYAFDLDVSTWGWIHMICGALVIIGGMGLFSGAMWAKVIAIIALMAQMLLNFFYIPYYPVWSLLIIAVAIVCIWAIVQYPRDMLSDN